jgi:hypothetical protein
MTNSPADTLVIQTVRTIRDRFGVEGLRDLVELATRELREAERAVPADGAAAPRQWEDPAGDMADTQAWIAFTGDANER